MKARYWVIAAVVLATAAAVLIGASSGPPDSSFDFLAGKTPLQDNVQEFGWKMDGPIFSDLGMSSDDGPALRQRTKEYVYKADYKQTVAIARQEALRKGAKEMKEPDGASWEFGDKSSLFVSKGKYDPESGNTDEKAPFVRVTIMTQRKENWIGLGWRWVRSIFQR